MVRHFGKPSGLQFAFKPDQLELKSMQLKPPIYWVGRRILIPGKAAINSLEGGDGFLKGIVIVSRIF